MDLHPSATSQQITKPEYFFNTKQSFRSQVQLPFFSETAGQQQANKLQQTCHKKTLMHLATNTLHIFKVDHFTCVKSKQKNTNLILSITNKGVSVKAVRTSQCLYNSYWRIIFWRVIFFSQHKWYTSKSVAVEFVSVAWLKLRRELEKLSSCKLLKIRIVAYGFYGNIHTSSIGSY